MHLSKSLNFKIRYFLEQNLTFILSLLAGLGLVVFSMKNLASGFQVLFSRPIKFLINSISISPFVTLLVGAVSSLFVQSSFSSSLMALSYAGSGLLNLSQLILLIIGASLGTLPTVWLFSLESSGFDLYLIVLGVLPMLYASSVVLASLGKVIFSLGVLFLGYNLMIIPPGAELLSLAQSSVEYLSSFSGFAVFWLIVPVVVVCSMLLRSTVALMALLMALSYNNIIPVTLAIMLALAANLGRTVPVFISSFRAGILPKRGALFYFLVNFTGVFLVSIFFGPFFDLLTRAIGSYSFSHKVDLIPAAHTLYNIILVVFSFIFFIPLKWCVQKIFKDKSQKSPQKLKFLGQISHMSPILAIEQVYQEVKKMAATCETTLQLTSLYLNHREEEIVEKVLKYEKVTDNIRQEIFIYLSKVMQVSLSSKQGEQVRSLLRISNELESIADRCKQIILSQKEIIQLGVPLKGGLHDQFKKVMEKLKEVYEMTFFQLTSSKDAGNLEYRKYLTQFDQNLVELRLYYLQWIREEVDSEYQIEASLKYGDILFGIYQIRGRSQNIIESYRFGYL